MVRGNSFEVLVGRGDRRESVRSLQETGEAGRPLTQEPGALHHKLPLTQVPANANVSGTRQIEFPGSVVRHNFFCLSSHPHFLVFFKDEGGLRGFIAF